MSKRNFRIDRAPILIERVRAINGKGFCFFPHRFLHDGFVSSLNPNELLLYLLLVLAGDRNGISFYHADRLCTLLQMSFEQYLQARNNLITKDLIAYDGTRYQVLSLPKRPIFTEARALRDDEDFELDDPATIRILARQSLTEASQANDNEYY